MMKGLCLLAVTSYFSSVRAVQYASVTAWGGVEHHNATGEDLNEEWLNETRSGQICVGSSPLGSTNWQYYSKDGIYIDVDISECSFTDIPIIKTSISGTSNHWTTRGSSEIYKLSTKGFRIYLWKKSSLSVAYAHAYKYTINWVAASPGVHPDIGLCAGKGTSWKPYHQYITATAGTSHCGFKSTPVYLTSVTGTSDHWTTTGASEVYNPSPNSFTTYIWKQNGVSVSYAYARQYDVNWLAHDSSASSNKGHGCSGTANGWQPYSKNGIYTDVNAAHCGFTATPVYVASLTGQSGHWTTSGGSEIYMATPTGFRVYIHQNGGALSPSVAQRNGWYVTWGAAPTSVPSKDIVHNYIQSSVNCNCDSKRLKQKAGSSLDECAGFCQNDLNCKSFALWTTQGKNPKYCATYGKQCEMYEDGHSTLNECADPTAPAWFNIAYNMQYVKASVNCNCAKKRLIEKKDSSMKECWSLCESDPGCKSFAVWTRGQFSAAYYCTTYGSECTEYADGHLAGTKCRFPEPKVHHNLVYNKLPGLKDPVYVKSAVNCNCDSHRLQQKAGSSLSDCSSLCKDDDKCKSFAVWTAEGKDPGYCPTYGKKCPTSGSCPYPEAAAWKNIAYNMH